MRLIKFSLVFVALATLFLLSGFANLEQKEKLFRKEVYETYYQKIKTFWRELEVVATAYTSDFLSCGKWDGITASGKKAKWGTIAMDKKYKFGTKVYIPMFKKIFVVEDRGGAIKGNRIDIWFPSRQEALKFGVKKMKVYILSE